MFDYNFFIISAAHPFFKDVDWLDVISTQFTDAYFYKDRISKDNFATAMYSIFDDEEDEALDDDDQEPFKNVAFERKN